MLWHASVVVLGGGYAGIQVARPLDDLADVVLVEPKDDFVHNVAALRALVDPSWLERIYLPYTGPPDRGRVIRDRAVKADADRVVLASGAELFPDYLVLATGSGRASRVTLVDVASDVLGERYCPDLKAELRRQLTGLGAELLLGSPLKGRDMMVQRFADLLGVSTTATG